ncbi:hypothetical protein CYMTET_56577, partial [Cymbomonas tetramitiformis]
GGALRISRLSTVEMVASDIFANLVVGSDGHGAGVSIEDACELVLRATLVRCNRLTWSGQGAGVAAWQQSNVTLTEGCRVEGNLASTGGGLYGDTSVEIVVRDSHVWGNHATDAGGGIASFRRVVVINSTVTMNYAVDGGGGIHGTVVEVVSSSVNMNAGGRGGAIALFTNGASLLLARSEVLGNYARDVGGGIFLSRGAITLEAGSVLRENAATANGGGIMMVQAGAYLYLANSTIQRNQCTNGGGVYCTQGCRITISNGSSVHGNQAFSNGGGLYLAEDSTLEVLGESRVWENVCCWSGAGIMARAGSLVLLAGGSSVEGNVADREGGGITLNRGKSILRPTTLWVTRAAVMHNVALTYSGGGIVSDMACAVWLGEGSVVYGNWAGYEGGGISARASSLQLSENTAIAFNKALNGGGIALSGPSDEIANSSNPSDFMHASGATFIGNSATYSGGALMVNSGAQVAMGPWSLLGVSEKDQSTMKELWWNATNSRLSQEAKSTLLTESGGGAPVSDELKAALRVTTRNCKLKSVCVKDNSAQQGAAFFFRMCWRGSTLARLHLEGNVGLVESSSGEQQPTSIIAAQASTALLVESRFIRNTGTALWVQQDSSVLVSGLRVAQHSGVDQGAAIYVDARSSALVRNSSFVNCSAQRGGAVFTAGRLDLVHSTFRGNGAALLGGAVYLQLNSQVTNITQCDFVNNTAGGVAADCECTASAASSLGEECGNGGALYIEGGGDPLEINRTYLRALTYAGNTAQNGGVVGYWRPVNLHASPFPPHCEGCPLLEAGDGNVAAYGSPGGWATAPANLEVDAVLAAEKGGFPIQQTITVSITDGNGEVVTIDSTSVVEMHFAQGGGCWQSQGAVRRNAEAGVVTFSGASSDLVISGAPGSRCEVYFTSTLGGRYPEGVISSITVVPLQYCQPGEELVNVATDNTSAYQMCLPCEAGKMSLGNESGCMDCPKALGCAADERECPIHCLGGDQFVVCQGAYVAPNAQYCGDDIACFFERVYSCPLALACTTTARTADGEVLDGYSNVCGGGKEGEGIGAERVGAGAASVAALRLCDETSFAGVDAVMCGGAATAACSPTHRTNILGDGCVPCEDRTLVMFTTLCGLVVLLLLLGAMFAVFRGTAVHTTVSRTKASVIDEVMTGEAQATSIHILKAKSAAALVLGYVQVISQLAAIFPQEVIPEVVNVFVARLDFVNLDVGFLFNLECFGYHFAPTVDQSAYWLSFSQSVALPTFLCLFFGAVYCYIVNERARVFRHNLRALELQAGHTLDAVVKKEKEATEEKWRSNMLATCSGAALFAMMFVHPGISTVIFQLFNCEMVHYDDVTLQAQHWLKNDITVECFTEHWRIGMVFAVITLITFTFGYPLSLLLGMSHLRRYHKLRIPRHEAERYVDLIRSGLWVLCAEEEVVILRLCGSFFVDPAERPEHSTRLTRIVSAARRVRKRAHGIIHNLQIPALRPSRLKDLDGHEDAAQHSDRHLAEEGAWQPLREAVTIPGRLRSVAKVWKSKAKRHVSARNNMPVDVYLPRESFVVCSGRRAQDLQDTWDGMWKRPPPLLAQACFDKAVRRMGKMVQSADNGNENDRDEDVMVVLRDGRVIESAHLYLKVQLDGDAVRMTRMTRMDNEIHSRVLGQFTDPFKPQFFFWQSYEITRRMLQTGIVVLVGLFAGDGPAIMYAMIISVVAIMLHMRYSPYKNAALDDLQLAILVNQFAIQIMILMVHLDERTSGFLGISLLIMQCVLLTYAMTLIVPAFRPVLVALRAKINQLSKPVANSFLIRSLKESVARSFTVHLSRFSLLGSFRETNPMRDDKVNTVAASQPIIPTSATQLPAKPDDGKVDVLAAAAAQPTEPISAVQMAVKSDETKPMNGIQEPILNSIMEDESCGQAGDAESPHPWTNSSLARASSAFGWRLYELKQRVVASGSPSMLLRQQLFEG